MDVPNPSSFPSSDEAKEILRKELAPHANVNESEVALEEEIIELNANAVRELNVEKQIAQEQLNRLIDDNQARKRFSQWIFTVTIAWMFCVLMIVVQCARGNFHLSDGVMIALITTTTANVFGFFYVVVNYLFNRNKST
jgi:hypothetical protein